MAEKSENDLDNAAIAHSIGDKPTPRSALTMTFDSLMSHSGEKSPANVYVLDLHGYQIRNIENLGKFTHLRSLDLSCNNLTKVHSSMFSSNTFLCELKLYSNAITDIQDMYKVKKLVRLSLQMNHIAKLGNTLCNLIKLEILRLDFNLLTELDAAKELSGCNSLVYLNLAHNKLITVKGLSTLKQLNKIDISYNNLEGGLEFLINCTSLTDLDLSHNKFKGDFKLINLKQIENLNLSKNEIQTLNCTQGICYKSLKELDLSNNQLLSIPQDIALTCPNLDFLSICDNQIRSLDDLQVAMSRLDHITVCLLDGNPLLNIHDVKSIKEILKKSCTTLLTISKNSLPSTEKLLHEHEIEIESNFKEINVAITNYDILIQSTIDNLQSKIKIFGNTEIDSNQDGKPPSSSHSNSRTRLQDALDFASKTFSEQN